MPADLDLVRKIGEIRTAHRERAAALTERRERAASVLAELDAKLADLDAQREEAETAAILAHGRAILADADVAPDEPVVVAPKVRAPRRRKGKGVTT